MKFINANPLKKLYSTWTVLTVLHLEDRKVQPTMGISVIPVITPYSYSIRLGIWSVLCFAMAMCIGLMMAIQITPLGGE